MNYKNYVLKLDNNINSKSYDDLKSLEKVVTEHDKVALKLELDYKFNRRDGNTKGTNEFLAYDKDKLAGYIGISNFSGDTLEVNGMVHPDYRRQGIFKNLFSLVQEEFHERKAKEILLLCDNKSVPGQKFLKTIGAVYSNSEYEMYLDNSINITSHKTELNFRKAVNADAPMIAKQNSIYFGEVVNPDDYPLPEEEEKCGTTSYIVELNSEIVGKVNLSIENSVGGIYGVGVLPEYRRKGYGRAILNFAIAKFKENNIKDIMLQVAVKNSNALDLYKSCGFKETSVMDYFDYIG